MNTPDGTRTRTRTGAISPWTRGERVARRMTNDRPDEQAVELEEVRPRSSTLRGCRWGGGAGTDPRLNTLVANRIGDVADVTSTRTSASRPLAEFGDAQPSGRRHAGTARRRDGVAMTGTRGSSPACRRSRRTQMQFYSQGSSPPNTTRRGMSALTGSVWSRTPGARMLRIPILRRRR